MRTKRAEKPVELKPKPTEYLTDGAGLWRFEMFLPDGEGVVVEDAWTGTTVRWDLKEFAEMGLRIVDPEGAAGE